MIKNNSDALSVLYSCAREYDKNLLGKKFLIIHEDKHHAIHYTEIVFEKRNFKHLTGVVCESIQSADFYDRCLDHRLALGDFKFNSNGTTPLKLAVLPRLVKKNMSANMIGMYNKQQPILLTERLVGSVHGCLGFVRDSNHGIYVPNTALAGDIRDLCEKPYEKIILICSKDRVDEKYQHLVYVARNVDMKQYSFPQELLEMLENILKIQSAGNILGTDNNRA